MITVGIVGGGAAGLFAACQLKRLAVGKDIEVTILEKNQIPGQKLTLTGHGRCNITNRKDPAELKNGFHEAGNFIYPALKEFTPDNTMEFCERELGLKLKEEENNRIFPVCDSAVKVRDTILTYISDSSKTITGAAVLDICKKDVFEISTKNGDYTFDHLILSCGGSSFTGTGSAGDSYVLAGRMGHTIVPVRAALAPIALDRDSSSFTKELSGVSVNAKASLYCDGKVIATRSGDVLFADFGLTGPAIMELSREIPVDINGKNVFIELDLIPSLTEEQLDQELQNRIADHHDTKISNLLSDQIPASVAEAITRRAGMAGSYAQSFTKENRKKLRKELKHLCLVLNEAPVIDRAYVTRGGVSLKEVDRKTMESKVVPGLYIIGEALDVDGISGGYNLQACMSEAYLAAKSIISSAQ